MNLDEQTIANLIVERMCKDDALVGMIVKRFEEVCDECQLVGPEVASKLLDVEKRHLKDLIEPKKLSERTTRYRLRDIKQITQ